MPRLFITGTDTGVGKTVIAAALTHACNASYYKPVQSGTCSGTDTDTVARLLQLPPERIILPRYNLKAPLSPHEAAAEENITLDTAALARLPQVSGNLIVEGAGGLFAPLTNDFFIIDLIAACDLPVVLVARSSLGTINHTLLSLAALRSRRITLNSIIINGALQPETTRLIAAHAGGAPVIAVPPYADLTRAALHDLAQRLESVTTSL